jgi:hypothetical protein
MSPSGTPRRLPAAAFAAAVLLVACEVEPLQPYSSVSVRLAGASPAESLAIIAQVGGWPPPGTLTELQSMTIASAGETCTLTYTSPNSVSGCTEPVPSVAPPSPWAGRWLYHSGGIHEPEQREPIHITFPTTVRGITLVSTGALKCSGTLGRMRGFRDGVQVAQADNELIDPEDCPPDDVTYGVMGSLPPYVVIDSLVIDGVDPWTLHRPGLAGTRPAPVHHPVRARL